MPSVGKRSVAHPKGFSSGTGLKSWVIIVDISPDN